MSVFFIFFDNRLTESLQNIGDSLFMKFKKSELEYLIKYPFMSSGENMLKKNDFIFSISLDLGRVPPNVARKILKWGINNRYLNDQGEFVSIEYSKFDQNKRE